MQIKKDLIDYDFQGWPVFKKNMKEILLALGGKIENDKIVFDLNDPIMEVYPESYEDDGMAYGVNKQIIVEVDKFNDNEQVYVHLFRARLPKMDKLKELYARWEEDEQFQKQIYERYRLNQGGKGETNC